MRCCTSLAISSRIAEPSSIATLLILLVLRTMSVYKNQPDAFVRLVIIQSVSGKHCRHPCYLKWEDAHHWREIETDSPP